MISAQVITKRAFKECPWGRQRRSEEHDLIKCLRRKGMAPCVPVRIND